MGRLGISDFGIWAHSSLAVTRVAPLYSLDAKCQLFLEVRNVEIDPSNPRKSIDFVHNDYFEKGGAQEALCGRSWVGSVSKDGPTKQHVPSIS